MSLFEKLFGSSEDENKASKMEWRQLTDISQLDAIVDESNTKPVAIFKHSTRCSVSRMALRHFESDFDLEDKITPYFLDLLEHRDISNEIATRFGVEHQSPQLILISRGKSVYDASHNSIEGEDLKRYL